LDFNKSTEEREMKKSKILLSFFVLFILSFMVSCEGLPTGLTDIESSDLETITDLLTTQTSEEGTQIITTAPLTSSEQETSDVVTTTEPEPTTTVEQTTTTQPTTTEGPTTDLPTHRIYFLNSVGWESVYAYAWIGEEQHLGPMPGTLATQEAETDWWYVDVQVNFDVNEIGLIFNNGDLDNLLQTPDVMLDSPFYLYVTITGESFVTKTLAEDSFVSNRVWFYNSDNWAQVNAYAWVGSSRILGNFPGQPATQEGETDWWYVDLPYDFSEIPVNIIFNENENIKTADILLENNTHVYVSVDSMVFDSKEALENSLVQTTVWFYNSEAWDDVYIKGRISRQIIDDEIIYEAIPNTLANQEADSNWWSFKLPVDASVYHTEVIFNNGNDIETSYIMIDTNADAFVTFSGEVFSSKELAIDSLDLPSTTVYYYNSEGWVNINAYVFGDSGEVLGPWQGSPAVEDTENPHWWMIEVPLDASVNPFNIIFNNEDGSLQSGEALIDDLDGIYVSLSGGPYTSRQSAIDSLSISTTLYFYNSQGWTEVYAYMFGTAGKLLGEWGGSLATQDTEDPDWWMIDIPLDTSNSNFFIIFHNNQGDQTMDIAMNSQVDVYLTVNGDVFASKADAEASLIPLDTTTIYFYNSDQWNEVYAFAYDENGTVLTSAWPGDMATNEEGSDWWTIEVDADLTTTKLTFVFNNNDQGLQSENIHIESVNGVYSTINGESFTSKADAEASLIPEETTTIYFYNSDGWTEVYAFAYVEAGTPMTNLWPGDIATQEVETDWWTIEIPVDLETEDLTIIFNDNNQGLQTSNILIETSTDVYTTVNGENFSSKVDAEASLIPEETTTIYFYNSDGWNEVYAFAYVEAGTPITNLWPGDMATKEAETDWWTIEIPVDLETEVLTIIFNNNDNGLQTSNIIINNTTDVYTTINGENYASKADAEASLIAVDSTTVHFYNSDGWNSVNAYVFGEEGEVLGTWQGSPAVEDIENPHWWKIDVPLDASTNPFTIIFNNSDGSLQSGQATINNAEAVYVSLTGGPYTSRQLAIESLSASTTLYFYNSEGWAEVYAFMFGTAGTLLGEWGGSLAIQDGEDPDWWMIDVPVDSSTMNYMMVFHNNQGDQTVDISINSESMVYVTVDGNVFASKAEAEASMAVTTTIYFYNSNQWGSIYAYAKDHMGNELLGASPGTQALQDGSSDWYFIEVPIDLSQDSMGVVFGDNGANTLAEVTMDDSAYVYLDVNGNLWQSKALAERAISSGEMTRIHFYNSLGWEEVYAYVADQTMILPNWPGMKAIQDGDTDWWYIDLPNDTALNPVDVTCNMGDASQVAGQATINTNDHVYVSMAGLTYTSKSETETAMSVSTRIYFYNSKGWASVSAYVDEEDYGNLLGGWPGTEATQDMADPDWWYVDVPIDPSIHPIQIEFGNNDPNGMVSSYQVTINSLDGVYVSYYGDVFTSRTAIENEINVTTRVYFYNSNDWAEVSAYAYLEPGELLTLTWPGDMLTKENETDDWWYIDVPYDADKQSFTIIFNNNNNDLQTSNIIIDSTTNVYTNVNGAKFATKADAEASMVPIETTTIYFYNSDGWTEVYAFAYIEAGTPITNMWPGDMATKEETSDWWTIEIPVDLANDVLTIIFNNNNNGLQTSNILIDASTDVYTTVNGESFSSKADAEASLIPVDTTTIYFYNHESWIEPYAFIFDAFGNFYGVWPGSAMIQEGDSDWWTIEVDVDPVTNPIKIVFSNNGYPKTQDMLIDDASNVYLVPSGGKYADKASAESNLETSTRIYFYNPIEVDWDVTAHMWLYNGDNPNLNTNWPGTSLTQWYMDDDNNPETPDIATDWWYVDVSTTTSSFMLVLSDNASPQTKDLLIYAYDEVFISLNQMDTQDGKYTVNMYFDLETAEAGVSVE
jgi:hypothetical protein